MGKKKLNIAIDAGFDGAKIVVNGNLYHIPFVIQDITDEVDSYGLRRTDDKYVRCIKNDRTYLIGEIARTYLMTSSRNKDKKSVMEPFYTMERYNMPIFETALDAFLAYGIARYSMDSNFDIKELDNYDVNVGVALPHSYVEDLYPYIEKYLAAKQELTILIGDQSFNISYTVNDTFYNSQIVCLLLNEVVDDNGKDYSGVTIYDMLPALVLDGGYKTFGEFIFARDESIVGADSNMDYAMMNINKRVADEIKKVSDKYDDYNIEEMYHKNDVVRYQDNDGKIQSINVVELKDSILKEVSNKMLDHLCEKYENLLDVNTILIGGGTGSAYYPFIKEFCESEGREYLKDHVILAGQKPFNGKVYPSVFAVVCGLYKDMLMQINED